MYNG
jgi:hypothetical protein